MFTKTDSYSTPPGPPVPPAKIYREQRTPLYLTDFQILTLLKTIDKKSSQGFRDYTIFILLIHYGLRISEVANLPVDDINWEDKTMVIKDRKNHPHLLLPLIEQVARILKAYITLFRPSSWHPGYFYEQGHR